MPYTLNRRGRGQKVQASPQAVFCHSPCPDLIAEVRLLPAEARGREDSRGVRDLPLGVAQGRGDHSVLRRPQQCHSGAGPGDARRVRPGHRQGHYPSLTGGPTTRGPGGGGRDLPRCV